MTIYRGVGGVNREIKQQFRGVGGVNRQVFQKWNGELYDCGNEFVNITGGIIPFNYSSDTGAVKNANEIQIISGYGYAGITTAKALSKGGYTNINVMVSYYYTNKIGYIIGKCMDKCITSSAELNSHALSSVTLSGSYSAVQSGDERTFTWPISAATFFPLLEVDTSSSSYRGHAYVKKIWLS